MNLLQSHVQCWEVLRNIEFAKLRALSAFAPYSFSCRRALASHAPLRLTHLSHFSYASYAPYPPYALYLRVFFLWAKLLYKQHQAEIDKKLRKSWTTTWGWAFSKNVQASKCGCCNEIIWLIAMEMKPIMKNRSYN